MKTSNKPTATGIGRVVYTESFSPKDDGKTHQKKMNAYVQRLHLAIREAHADGAFVRLVIIPNTEAV